MSVSQGSLRTQPERGLAREKTLREPKRALRKVNPAHAKSLRLVCEVRRLSSYNECHGMPNYENVNLTFLN